MKGSKFLYPAVLKTLIVPPLLWSCILVFLPTSIGSLLVLRALGWILSFPVVFIIRSHFSLLVSTRQARALGATDIPRVKGRWPLNLDILVDWAKSGSEEEVGRMMVLLGRKYGNTYNTRVLGEDQIISSDPNVLKHVLLDEFNNFVKGAKFKERAEAFLGDGIFNSDGERWKFHRSLMRPFFHPIHISPKNFTPSISSYISSLPHANSYESFDIQAGMGKLALEMAILWMTGEDISSSSDFAQGSSEWEAAKSNLGPAMTQAQNIVGKRVKVGTVWPLFELFHDPLEKPMKNISTFFRPIIDRAMSRKGLREDMEQSKQDTYFIDRLVDATDDRKVVEDQLINVLLASRDTLASCLTFCVYVLCLHPEIGHKLREEIRSVAGKGEVAKDMIRDLRYCRAYINEVLRLYPPVPLNIRRTLRPSLLPVSKGQSPMYMPGNTSIILAFILLQRDPLIWGENANEFQPERWLGEGLSKREREGFMSWNYGPRMCLGQPLALTLTHIFLILFCRHLDKMEEQGKQLKFAFDAQPEGTTMPSTWRTPEGSDGRARDGKDEMWVVADVVLAIKGGLWVRFDDANEEETMQ
ncbi:uncharacterized protein IL334_000971 [Kwoniella shivajii]|uniref:Cytochrome P450 monooxygenase pc-2 n=1 Tax=Kwoniella shivajii TaxID=564305 RepID=A0ABZ1CQM5_9TREE|nr:hypothetical protein IL334_000971 [Kwoniella shivajii]